MCVGVRDRVKKWDEGVIRKPLVSVGSLSVLAVKGLRLEVAWVLGDGKR